MRKLLSLLTLVGISYLVEREGGWDTIQQWENVLSLVNKSAWDAHVFLS